MENLSGEWKKEIIKVIRKIFLESLIQASSQFIGKKAQKGLEKADQAIGEKVKKKKAKEEVEETEEAPKPKKKQKKSVPVVPVQDASPEPQEAPENVADEDVAEEVPEAE